MLVYLIYAAIIIAIIIGAFILFNSINQRHSRKIIHNLGMDENRFYECRSEFIKIFGEKPSVNIVSIKEEYDEDLKKYINWYIFWNREYNGLYQKSYPRFANAELEGIIISIALWFILLLSFHVLTTSSITIETMFITILKKVLAPAIFFGAFPGAMAGYDIKVGDPDIIEESYFNKVAWNTILFSIIPFIVVVILWNQVSWADIEIMEAE